MKKTIFVSGNFNILHTGHLRLLKFASELGEKLIVAVHSDNLGGDSIHVPEALRLEGLKSNRWVSEAILIDEPVVNIIEKIRPDIVVKGKEHELSINLESKVIESYGGKLIFSSGDISFSSVNLLRKESLSLKSNNIDIPTHFNERHDIDQKKLFGLVKKFSELKVCVIGDLILDEYVICEPLGMSQEDPTLVVKPIESKLFMGGAGIVASHAAGLGATTSFISIIGNDTSASFAKSQLKKNNVKYDLLQDESRPTTLKQRFRAKGKTLLRVSHLSQHSIGENLQDEIFNALKNQIKNLDIIIFSDFNYGALPQALVERITDIAKQNNIFLAADSQSSSQTGDISRFTGMDLITPTEREARLSLRDNESGLATLAANISEAASSKNLLLKLGEDGLMVHANSNSKFGAANDKIPALNPTAIDVAGAGDSLLISSALTIRAGGSIWDAGCMGSIAAAIQVSRIGNSPIQVNEIIDQLNNF
jgi:rfaE bifunctional protein kinase chain/domain